ncbi:MAG: helix-turn-helix domain-containing protein [Flavobacteriaceae bacterium]|jgi:transcriptional regulator with XRE-family HTH domain|nr:helix-turn-helix domain-containing protein [Flavobacteriaceae bacterium]
MSIGTKIHRLREERNWSQEELADLLDISQTKLHNIESGHSQKIDFLLMDKVCKVFDKDFEYFLEEKVVYNVEENNGQIAHNIGTINNFPENLIADVKKLVEDNKTKDKIIQELRERLGEK